MEMVMTNIYTFPPVAAEGEKERIIADEKKVKPTICKNINYVYGCK